MAVVFGCWTSASRKAVLPVFEKHKGLLFYPVQYEGLEASPNIFYTGATTNQQIVPGGRVPAAEQGKKKFFLLGSDYVFPRTANNIIKAQLGCRAATWRRRGVHAARPHRLRHGDQQDPGGQPGRGLQHAERRQQRRLLQAAEGRRASPPTSCRRSRSASRRRRFAASAPDNMAGHLTAWNYFQTTKTPENESSSTAYKAKFGDEPGDRRPDRGGLHRRLPLGEGRREGRLDRCRQGQGGRQGARVRRARGPVKIDDENQHISKTVRIGKVRADGQFEEVWNSRRRRSSPTRS